LTIQGGAMAIPAGPGLGVTLDHDKLARAHETFVKCGMRGRDDRSLMRRLEPGWKGELL
jgi:glucarate dehydratase